jgi:predicted dehydrogenase
MKTLRVGVIGLGVGKGHIRSYRMHPAAEVVAIADPDAERRQAIGAEYEIPDRYEDAVTMLEDQDLDIVSICTPNKFHKDLAISALETGCHVLCEKPMAMNAEEARQMNETAERTGRRLMINFSYRFSDQSQALKRQVDAGLLGEVYFGRTIWLRRRNLPRFGGWFGQKALAGGGPLIDLGVHRLDLALWLMGYPKPEWVMGATYDPIGSAMAREEEKDFDVEDLAVAMIRFDNGASLELEASWAGHISESELMETRLFGTKGGLVQRNVGGGYEFEAEIFTHQNGCPFDMKLQPPVPDAKPSQHHFIDCILRDEPHTATGEEGETVMKLLDTIYRSAEEKTPLQIG